MELKTGTWNQKNRNMETIEKDEHGTKNRNLELEKQEHGTKNRNMELKTGTWNWKNRNMELKKRRCLSH